MTGIDQHCQNLEKSLLISGSQESSVGETAHLNATGSRQPVNLPQSLVTGHRRSPDRLWQNK
ncbi:MAG: hypothetical protein GDA56_06005 [Hormoscilla sp. GM7CHS1pb]|nr:hypothetical protein [Hormoscilla sp. GM7CHS1pb]